MSASALLFAAILAAPMSAASDPASVATADEPQRFHVTAALTSLRSRHDDRFVTDAKAMVAPPTTTQPRFTLHATTRPINDRAGTPIVAPTQP